MVPASLGWAGQLVSKSMGSSGATHGFMPKCQDSCLWVQKTYLVSSV